MTVTFKPSAEALALAGVSGQPKAKVKSGHPTVPWIEYAREMYRGWWTGEAGASAWAEAHRLSEWAQSVQPKPQGGKVVKGTGYHVTTINNRILRRIGAKGYKAQYAQVQAEARGRPFSARLSVNDNYLPAL